MNNPFILQKESTVMDFASKVHHDFENNLKYVCMWGSGKFDSEQIDRDYILKDRDIVELHI